MTTYVVYGKENCPWCAKASEDLFMHGKVYEYHHVDKSAKRLEELKALVPGVKTVPQIFDPSGRHIGGYDELRKYLIAIQNKKDPWAPEEEE